MADEIRQDVRRIVGRFCGPNQESAFMMTLSMIMTDKDRAPMFVELLGKWMEEQNG